MALAMVRPTKDSRGVYEYKRRYPHDLAPFFPRNARWKRSLGTRDPSEALKRFAPVHVECERAFAMLRAVHLKGVQLSLTDAQQLASRWMDGKVDAMEASGDYSEFVYDDEHVDEEGELVSSWTPLAAWYEGTTASLVSGYIREALEANQYPPVAEGTALHAVLVEVFHGAVVQLSGLCYARLTYKGHYTPRPSVMPRAPLSVELVANPALSGSGPTLQYVFDKWAEDKLQTDPHGKRTVDDYNGTIRRFQELYGDLPVSSITRALIGDFRIALGKIPTKGAGIRALSAPEAIARGEAEGLPTASLATLLKQLKAFGAVLNFAVQRLEAMPEEPVTASGILKSIGKAAQRAEVRTGEDKVFTRSDLLKMLNSPLFKGTYKPSRADYGEALFWLPLLMLYTGARREEVAQLLVGDVGQCPDTGIWFLDFKPGEGKTVKTSSSRRRIPLHDDLLELGFTKYVQGVPVSGRVFPKLTAKTSNGYGYAVGVAWSKYLAKVVKLDTEADPSHGFRHTFKTICREVHIETAVADWITGHASTNVGAKYGVRPLQRMAEELKKFPSLAREAGLLPREG